MKALKKIENNAKFDRCLVIFCTIMVIISCVCTVYLVKQERKDAQGTSTDGQQSMDTEDDKNITGITARYLGNECYEGTYASKTAVKVYAKLKDGTRKEITKWDGVLGPVKEGDNTFTISYREYTTEIKITGIDIDSVTEAVNYNLYYFDSAAAGTLATSIKNGDESYDNVFDGVLFCGDSRTKAILTCQVIDEEKVLAENGVGLEHLDTYMQELLSRNPKTIIFNYGVNSMSTSSEARAEFVEQYKSLLQEIKRALPQTRLIVAAIFPVSQDFVYIQPRMEYIDDVNLELFKMCVDLDIEFIDGSDIIENNTYLINSDGLHFADEFYMQFWLEELVEKMGIGTVILD